MNTIPYVGSNVAGLWSVFGLIVILAVPAAISMNLTLWKPTTAKDSRTKGLLNFTLFALAAAWLVVWSHGVGDYNTRSAEAADRAGAQLKDTFGLFVDYDTALAIVQDDLGDDVFEAEADGQHLLMTGEWDQEGFHLNSVGAEVAHFLPNNL